MTKLEKQIEAIARRARLASSVVTKLSTGLKDRLLGEMADALLNREREILRENRRDIDGTEKLSAATRRASLIDRLTLNGKRVREMADGLRAVAALPDPVGQVVRSWERPNGLQVSRVRIPLGVIGIIYESRPNVTVDAAGLCLKSGNAVILRGGSEAIHSNLILGKILRETLKKNGVSPDLVQVVDTIDRKGMESLVRQTRYVDLMIPRGGESLMKWMEEHSRIPVIKHDKGVCHLFVDESADIPMAERIAFNAKVQRPGVCNAMETLLVHEKIAPAFLPKMIRRFQEAGVEIRGDPATCRLGEGVKKAKESDWPAEYLDLVLAVRVVPTREAAIRHIQKYGSLHTESIVTEDRGSAEEFLNRLDSSVVLWNASTRFNDGGQLGLGAEIGISTTKMHAFGPMGLEELTTTKFVVRGSGQVRE